MELLWDVWDSTLRPKVCKAEQILLFSDYDGTLTPIVSTPNQAFLSPDMKMLLRELAALSGFALAIISGRAVEDIIRLVGIEGIYYAGNHGLEIKGPDITWTSPQALEIASLIGQLARELESSMRHIPGVLIEDKRLTLSVHYRLAPEGSESEVRQILDELVIPRRHRLRVTSGKKVFEVRPLLDWDKGKAVQKLRELLGRDSPLLFYLGDDVTDEDAFKVLGKNDVGIFVGDPGGSSSASFFLPNTEEVKKFFLLLKKERGDLGR